MKGTENKMIQTKWGLRFPVGFQFTARGKRADLHTIIDYRIILDGTEHLVDFRYVTKHTFISQDIINNDICETTIQRSI